MVIRWTFDEVYIAKDTEDKLKFDTNCLFPATSMSNFEIT